MRLTELAHQCCREILSPGDAAIDATAGNGHDTLFLAETVGPDGTVFAFDIHPEAIAATSRRVAAAGWMNVVLLQRDHAELVEAIPTDRHGRIAAVMFNLGYRPGGDHEIVTRPPSTVAALQQSLRLLRPSGMLTVLAYTGHAGGREEADTVRQFFDRLDRDEWSVETFATDGSGTASPILFVATKR